MDLKLPNLGEGADSGTVVSLLVKEGERISKDQPILELENEKAVATIPSTAAGTVTKVYVRTGEKLSVGQRLISIEPSDSAEAPKVSKPQTVSQPKENDKEQPTAREGVPEPEDGEPAAETQSPFGPAAAPWIRKLARDLGINLSRVRGSERGGRIVLSDLRAYIQGLQSRPAGTLVQVARSETTAQPKAKSVEHIDFSIWGPITKRPLSPLRQVIARRMTESWTTVPRVTQFDEADITNANALRQKHAVAYAKSGAHLTLTSFALRAVVQTLKKHPVLNSSLDETAQELVLKEYFHIGVAVDTEAGLIVPVIRDVDKKSLLDLSKELDELAAKARERKLSAEELKGGTFTISNQGGIGSGHFTPIVNKPQVAILGLGRGAMKAVVRENRIEPRLILPLALSYDHRVIDGGAAARFMVDLVRAFDDFKEEDVQLNSSSSSFSSSSSTQ